MKKRILILTAGFGEGHNSAARGVRDGLARVAPDQTTVELRDLFAEAYGRINELVRRSYLALVNSAPRAWGFAGRFGPITHHPKGAFRTNDAEQIRAAVLGDLGLAHTPGWLFAAEIASGAVRPVLTAFEPPVLSISAVRPGCRFRRSRPLIPR